MRYDYSQSMQCRSSHQKWKHLVCMERIHNLMVIVKQCISFSIHMTLFASFTWAVEWHSMNGTGGDGRRITSSWTIVLVCVVYFLRNCNIYIFFYIMFVPSFQKSLWTSEHRLLSSNWIRSFSLMSRTQRIYCSSRTRYKSLSFVWRGDAVTEVEEPGAWQDRVGEWIIRLYPPVLLVNVRINWMSSFWDGTWDNGTLITVISYVSPSRGWTRT
jgi:hypothetical protein